VRVARAIAEIRRMVGEARAEGKTVALVPTMGAFHAGHLALMNRARRECGFVVVSLFVNPTQFGPSEDLAKYPRDLQRDSDMAEASGVDVIFAPSEEAVYPTGFGTYINVEGLSDVLEGASRPTHFRGVTTVVAKLFNMVAPDKAYFGMKDYQQLKVIKKMAQDLDFALEIVPVPTVREPDGLAMSSRNVYLSPEERTAATVLYRALEFAEKRIRDGERDRVKLEEEMRELIESEPLAKVDYTALVDSETLEAGICVEGTVVVALAVRIGNTRLIDNKVIEVGG
jgi:pantoate--beta-alanine ligase